MLGRQQLEPCPNSTFKNRQDALPAPYSKPSETESSTQWLHMGMTLARVKNVQVILRETGDRPASRP
ncbi:MAG: hypothetical protein USCAAHI_02181 [Beijerinckiaceae bacterium]|jgi:hypothetical protein|nr:MAG: hypothetical protein USCAAHI_02181 [Beijerinckiaceae bacterium]